MSTFAKWQPIYAEHNIPVFPVKFEDGDKIPAIHSYGRVGLQGSAKLARKFSDASMLGFMCGPRTKVLSLDVDTKDERILTDAIDRHGKSPVIVRTASGKFQIYYRHNGERRRIRPWGDDLPIDQLGAGGYVVGVPSEIGEGRYEFVQGGLDDFDRLPVMRAPALAPAPGQPQGLESTAGTVPHGMRNDALFDHCMRAAHHCDTRDTLLDVARTFVMERCEVVPTDPVTDDEVVRTVESVWQKTQAGENWFGRGGRVVFHHDDIDGLMAEHPDAFLLEVMLRRHHWNRDFVIANAMAERMPGGGWDRKRFARARRVLIERGRVEVVRHPRQQSAGIYRWPKSPEIQGGQK